jgi:hypothetical protein
MFISGGRLGSIFLGNKLLKVSAASVSISLTFSLSAGKGAGRD